VLFLGACWIGQGHVKNLIGSALGYSSCPNCGDSWWWKEDGTLWFTLTSGVIICKSCLLKPEKLDEKRILEHLKKHNNWPDEEIELVGEALKNFKAEKVGISM